MLSATSYIYMFIYLIWKTQSIRKFWKMNCKFWDIFKKTSVSTRDFFLLNKSYYWWYKICSICICIFISCLIISFKYIYIISYYSSCNNPYYYGDKCFHLNWSLDLSTKLHLLIVGQFSLSVGQLFLSVEQPSLSVGLLCLSVG